MWVHFTRQCGFSFIIGSTPIPHRHCAFQALVVHDQFDYTSVVDPGGIRGAGSLGSKVFAAIEMGAV